MSSRRIYEPFRVRNGDRITIGGSTFVFRQSFADFWELGNDMIELVTTGRRDSQSDSHFFKPEEYERRPQKVEQLHGDKQNP